MKRTISDLEAYDLWVRLQQTAHVTFQVREQELRHFGITHMESAVLWVVMTIGSRRATPAEIARRLFRTPHSVSQLLTRMEREGLVTRVSDLERKNQVRIVLTDKGQQAALQSNDRGSMRQMASSLSEKQRQQLMLLLDRLLRDALVRLGKGGLPELPSDNIDL